MKNLMIGLVIVLSFPCLRGMEPEKCSNHIIKSKGAESIENECGICFDSLQIGQAVVLSCKHCLHVECLQNMLKANGPCSGLCPLCRRPIEPQVQALFGRHLVQGRQPPPSVVLSGLGQGIQVPDELHPEQGEQQSPVVPLSEIEQEIQAPYEPQLEDREQSPSVAPGLISFGGMGLLIVSLGLGYGVYRYFKSE